MEITFTKKENRTLLTCERDDGSFTQADLGPSLPYHDLGHFVVEKTLELNDGVFGNLASGYTIEQLMDKDVIASLGEGSIRAEILTRNVQSMRSGSVAPEEFNDVVALEFAESLSATWEPLSLDVINSMVEQYSSLCEQWSILEDGAFLKLTF